MVIEELVKDHLSALGSGDLNRIIAHYHNDAVIVHQQGVSKGNEEIHGLFKFFVNEVLIPGKTELAVQNINSEGNIGYLVWAAESPTYSIPFATDTFVFKDGLIVQQTTAGMMNPKKVKP